MRKCNIFLFAILIIALSFQGYVAYENFRDKKSRTGKTKGRDQPQQQQQQQQQQQRPSGDDLQEIKMKVPSSFVKNAQQLAGSSMQSIQKFHDQLHK